MKKIFIGSFLILYFLPGSAQQNKLTLQQCIETGIANNLDVLQSDLQAQADEISWKQARLNRLPDLNGSAGYAINTGRSIDPFTNTYINEKISHLILDWVVVLPLFNGFTKTKSCKQNRLNYEAQK
jgi:outer membrane protein